MPTRDIERINSNSRLLKNYGSWLYCAGCGETVAYICYTTYKWIRLSFTCACGTSGSLELKEKGCCIPERRTAAGKLAFIHNRYCCPIDEDPLFSVVTKRAKRISYTVACLRCQSIHEGEISGGEPL